MDARDTAGKLSTGDHLPRGFVLDNRYVIEETLGVSPDWFVYAARDTLLFDNRIALKIARRESSPESPSKASDGNGFRHLSDVHGENIVQVYEAGQIRGRFYFSLECINGETLEQRLRRGPLSKPDIAMFTVSIFCGLHAIHSADLLHANLTPRNIFVTSDGIYKLADFGFPAPMFREGGSTNDHPSDVNYAAPEVLLNKTPCPQSDFYSAGAVIFEAVTGAPPNRVGAETKARTADDAPSIKEAAPDSPGWLDELVTHLLAKRVSQRPDSARQIVEWIEQATAPSL